MRPSSAPTCSAPRPRRSAWSAPFALRRGETGASSGLAALSLSFFVPALGAFGLWAAFAASSTASAAKGREPWSRLHVDPSIERTPHRARRAANPVAIAAVLANRTPEHARRRFEAMLRTADLPPRAAVRLLKSALKDPSEEVRLFAFSRLETPARRPRTGPRGASRRALDTADDDATREHLRLRLAETHWEFAYLGLAEGAVLEHALERAVEHASESKRFGKNATASFLLGRILLFRRETEGATVELERAGHLGYPMTKILPYLAECAFEDRSFAAVRSYLRQLERSTGGHAPLARVREFWR